jgi:hypothetical protein
MTMKQPGIRQASRQGGRGRAGKGARQAQGQAAFKKLQ